MRPERYPQWGRNLFTCFFSTQTRLFRPHHFPLSALFYACETQRNYFFELCLRLRVITNYYVTGKGFPFNLDAWAWVEGTFPLENIRLCPQHTYTNSIPNHLRFLGAFITPTSFLQHSAAQFPECSLHALIHSFAAMLFFWLIPTNPLKFSLKFTPFESFPTSTTPSSFSPWQGCPSWEAKTISSKEDIGQYLIKLL